MSPARRWHDYVGRRIEDPRGGTPPPTFPSGRSRPNVDVDVDRKANLSSKPYLHSFRFEFEISSCTSPAQRPKISKKSVPGPSKIEPRSLQNRGPRHPKSSPELFKTPFFETSKLRSLKGGPHPNFAEAKTAIWDPIPCAAHVPPRCKGETKSRSKWQSVGTAF